MENINEVNVQLESNELPEVCMKFLDYLKYSQNRSKFTIKEYGNDLKQWIKSQFVNNTVTLEALENYNLSNIYDFMGELNKKENTATTIRRKVASIRSFFTYLCDLQIIKYSPMVSQKIKLPKPKKVVKQWLNEEQCKQILNSVNIVSKRHAERNFAILTLLLNTGIREGELVGINIKNINGNKLIVKKGKGDKERQISLNEACLDAINNYLFVNKYINGEALFTSERGCRINEATIANIVREHGNYIGIENLTPHNLRHTALTILLQNGTDIMTVQAIAGHEDITTTQRYLHTDIIHMEKAVNNTGLSNFKRNNKDEVIEKHKEKIIKKAKKKKK